MDESGCYKTSCTLSQWGEHSAASERKLTNSDLNKYEAYFSHLVWIPKVDSSELKRLSWKPSTVATIFLLYHPLLMDMVLMFSKGLLYSRHHVHIQKWKKREVWTAKVSFLVVVFLFGKRSFCQVPAFISLARTNHMTMPELQGKLDIFYFIGFIVEKWKGKVT